MGEDHGGGFDEIAVEGALEGLHGEVAGGLEEVGQEGEDLVAELDGAFAVGVAGGVWGHVGEDDIESGGRVGGGAEEGFWIEGPGVALEGVDIGREGDADALEVEADDGAGGSDEFGGDLEPCAGCAAEVEDAVGGADELFGVLDLLEFEGGARGVALGLGLSEVGVVELSSSHRGDSLMGGWWNVAEASGKPYNAGSAWTFSMEETA